MTDREIVICSHSITALLQYTNLNRTVRFLETFTGHVAGAVAQYHMDPDSDDDETKNRIQRVFDAMIEYQDTDRWIVTSPESTA